MYCRQSRPVSVVGTPVGSSNPAKYRSEHETIAIAEAAADLLKPASMFIAGGNVGNRLSVMICGANIIDF